MKMFTPAHEIPMRIRRMACAVHEAGHALVAIIQGRKVTGAILRPPDGLSGETQFANEPDQMLDLNVAANRHVVEDAIVTLLAGQIAEAGFWKKVSSLYTPFVDSHRDDTQEIQRLKAGFDFSPEQDVEYMAHCTKKVEGILHDGRSSAAIGEIAEKLSENLAVSRAELDEILLRHCLITGAGSSECGASCSPSSD
jgi:ATP-dependent Zn protease